MGGNVESVAEQLRKSLEACGELVVRANASSGWFAVSRKTWNKRIKQARRDGRDGPNLVIYRTGSDRSRDHYAVPYSIARKLLVEQTVTMVAASRERRWNMTLRSGRLHVTHRAGGVDVSRYEGERLLLEANRRRGETASGDYTAVAVGESDADRDAANSRLGSTELTVGETYSRQLISRLLGGGSVRSYLPHKDGRVLCGCFDPEVNWGAPAEVEIEPGPDVERSAEMLLAQDTAVPVFLRRGPSSWEYVGDYRADEVSRDSTVLADARQRRANAVAVIYLSKAVPASSVSGQVDTVNEALGLLEGEEHLVTHKRRERRPELGKAKRHAVRKERGYLACEACESGEPLFPADLGEGCFEIHHIVPLSDLPGARHTRLDDLAILCANCHRMIHRANPMPSVAGLREMLARHGARSSS